MKILYYLLVIGAVLLVARVLDILSNTFSSVKNALAYVGINTDVLSFNPLSLWEVVLGVVVGLVVIGVVLTLAGAIREKR